MTTNADRRAGVERGEESLLHTRRARQRQIIVRGKMSPCARLQGAQPIGFFQGRQSHSIAVKLACIG
ncbi:hypothetical protein ACVWW1_008989 [Bradyrhizobium sp. JR3.5]